MDFLKYAGAVLTDAVDAISIANRRLALTNRLKAIDRAETAKAKAVYEDMGRYVAAHLDDLDMDDLKHMKEIAETAEKRAELARSHVHSMKHPEDDFAPAEKTEQSEFVIVDDEDAYYAEKEAAEAAAAAETEEAAEEEAAEDANDSIPFV